MARARRQTRKKATPRPRKPARARRPPPRSAARRAPAGPLTQAAYARHRGVSREAVRKAVRDGRISVDARGRIDPAAADSAWRANTDPSKISGRPGPAVAGPVRPPGPPGHAAATAAALESLPEGLTYSEARAMREWNQALLLDLQRRVRAGELADVAEFEDAAFRAARTARDLLLAIADALEDELAAITDPKEINRRLKEEIRRVCDEHSLALKLEAEDEEAPEGGAAEAAS